LQNTFRIVEWYLIKSKFVLDLSKKPSRNAIRITGKTQPELLQTKPHTAARTPARFTLEQLQIKPRTATDQTRRATNQLLPLLPDHLAWTADRNTTTSSLHTLMPKLLLIICGTDVGSSPNWPQYYFQITSMIKGRIYVCLGVKIESDFVLYLSCFKT
jgi:hypothetical protein